MLILGVVAYVCQALAHERRPAASRFRGLAERRAPARRRAAPTCTRPAARQARPCAARLWPGTARAARPARTATSPCAWSRSCAPRAPSPPGAPRLLPRHALFLCGLPAVCVHVRRQYILVTIGLRPLSGVCRCGAVWRGCLWLPLVTEQLVLGIPCFPSCMVHLMSQGGRACAHTAWGMCCLCNTIVISCNVSGGGRL